MSIAPRKAAVIQHAQTKEHKQKLNAQSQSLNIGNVFQPKPKIPDSVRKAELELAICVCCHTSILAIDHLGEVIKKKKELEVILAKSICTERNAPD